MDKINVNEVLAHLKSGFISAGIKVQKIYLFGSATSGSITEGSDIDVVIISPDFAGHDIFERARLTGRAEWNTINHFHVPMDVLMMTSEEFENSLTSTFPGRWIY